MSQSKLKILEKHLEKQKSMFADGAGFGDPSAQRNAELNISVTLAEIEIENGKRIKRIEWLAFIFAFIQTAFTIWDHVK